MKDDVMLNILGLTEGQGNKKTYSKYGVIRKKEKFVQQLPNKTRESS